MLSYHNHPVFVVHPPSAFDINNFFEPPPEFFNKFQRNVSLYDPPSRLLQATHLYCSICLRHLVFLRNIFIEFAIVSQRCSLYDPLTVQVHCRLCPKTLEPEGNIGSYGILVWEMDFLSHWLESLTYNPKISGLSPVRTMFGTSLFP